MTKFIGIILSVALVAGQAMAGGNSRPTPSDSRGGAISHPLYGGSEYGLISSTTEKMICTGKCLLLAVWRSTGAASQSLVLRDSGATGGADESVVFDRIAFDPSVSSAYQNPIPFPVIFTNGIAADLTNAGAGEEALIMYIDLDR